MKLLKFLSSRFGSIKSPSLSFAPEDMPWQSTMAFASALLLILSFPGFSQNYLAWVALAPLLNVIAGGVSIRRALWLGWLTGVILPADAGFAGRPDQLHAYWAIMELLARHPGRATATLGSGGPELVYPVDGVLAQVNRSGLVRTLSLPDLCSTSEEAREGVELPSVSSGGTWYFSISGSGMAAACTPSLSIPGPSKWRSSIATRSGCTWSTKTLLWSGALAQAMRREFCSTDSGPGARTRTSPTGASWVATTAS